MNRIMNGEMRHEEEEGFVLIVVDVVGSQFSNRSVILASIKTGNFLRVVKSSPP